MPRWPRLETARTGGTISRAIHTTIRIAIIALTIIGILTIHAKRTGAEVPTGPTGPTGGIVVEQQAPPPCMKHSRDYNRLVRNLNHVVGRTVKKRVHRRVTCARYNHLKARLKKARADCKHKIIDSGVASNYGRGDGLLGSGLACGGVLTESVVGFAHKSLPCGTRVTFKLGRRIATGRVIDRGPYVAGRAWDFAPAMVDLLGAGGNPYLDGYAHNCWYPRGR